MSVLQALSGIAALLAVAFSFVSLFAQRRWKKKDEMEAAMRQEDSAVLAEIRELKSDVADVKNRLSEHCHIDAENRAKSVRARILRFNDDIITGALFSEEHWNQALEDCDEYETFCDNTPDFKNGKAKAAIQNIRETYADLKKSGSFLKKK